MENFALVLVYLLLGYFLRRLPQFPANTGLVLNQFVLYIALPALVLQKIPQLQFSSQLLLPALVPWALLFLVAAAVVMAGRFWGWQRQTTAALLVVLPLGNTSFLGFPMVEAFFGSSALPVAMIYDQAGSFVALATWSTIIAALYNPNADKPTVGSISKRILLFPSFIALATALLLKNWAYPYPAFIDTLLSSLSATLVPVIMIAVGFQFRLQLEPGEKGPLAFAVAVKLLGMPLCAWLILLAFHVEQQILQVTVFEAAMPPMVSAGAIAIAAGLAPRFVSALVGLGLVLSFITLPLWSALLGGV
ncbi:AEC family transporter [Rheinheimera sp.]|uniref:AEC family transporter n=1 Tax=Rheinheimera sp. TaxID=1869214 RepID=UPI003AF90D60